MNDKLETVIEKQPICFTEMMGFITEKKIYFFLSYFKSVNISGYIDF